MNRKMTLFALGAKCGGRGASGFADGAVWLACAGLSKKPSCDKSAVSATPVKPAPASQRNSRRVRRQKVLAGLESFISVPIHRHPARVSYDRLGHSIGLF